MPVSDEFLAYVLDQLRRWGGVSVRRMVGGGGISRRSPWLPVRSDPPCHGRPGLIMITGPAAVRPSGRPSPAGPFKEGGRK